jgi:uncharacterized membrane protein
MRLEESVEIDRPLEEVFGYVSDVGNYPEWMAHVLEVRTHTPGPPQHQRWHSAFQEVPGGTRFTRAVEVESHGLLKLLEPLQRRAAGRQLKNDLQTLKDVVEGR